MLWRAACRVVGIVLLGGLLSAVLVRYAPGFGSDEEKLDTRFSEGSLRKLEERHEPERDVAGFYWRFLVNYVQGDLGQSRLLQRPVASLFAERLPVTAAAVAAGLAAAWMLVLVTACAVARSRSRALGAAGRAGATVLQCLPAGVLALLILGMGGRGAMVCGGAIAVVLYPRLLHYVLNLLEESCELAHVVTARAKGAGEWRILRGHVLPVCLPQLVALGGTSVSMALSAAIPLEAILDMPGAGQLAWQAALARDLTLLVNVTMLMSLAITIANTAAAAAGRRRPAWVEAA